MAAPFIGNQDYRGYLNYLGSQGNNQAKALLNYVGNTGGFDPNKLNSLDAQNNNARFYADYLKLSSPTGSTVVQPGASYSAPAPVYAPKIDMASLRAQARANAENAVNPYYTDQLNKFLAQQAVLKQQQQQAHDIEVEGLKAELTNTLAGNEITRGRTAEDTATKLADINTQADQFQTDTGQAFDASRINTAKGTAQAGLTGGLGAQQTEAATTAANTTEKRQEQQFQVARDQQNLFKTRTFEDLARSGELATQAEARGEKKSNFDLDTYIQNLDYETTKQSGAIRESQRQALAQNEQAQLAVVVGNWIDTISNPAQRAAAYTTYGGYL